MTQSMSRATFLKLAAATGTAALLGRGGEAMAKPEAIKTRPIPNSGEALPVVGVGTWQTFDVGDDPAARAQRAEVLKLLFEAGGSVIDSSPMYGRSEGVVGDLLTQMNAHENAFLATKVWTWGEGQGRRQMDQSFELLQSEKIDLIQIHNLVDWQTHLKTLRALKEAGRIRYIGITHYTDAALPDLAEVIKSEPIDFVQMAYSIRVRDPENMLLPLAAERNVAVIVNRPYEGGSLFRTTRGDSLPGWAADYGIESWGQFFLKYILSHPAVTCVIPGTSKPRHLLDNVGAGRGPLPDAKTRAKMVQVMEAD